VTTTTTPPLTRLTFGSSGNGSDSDNSVGTRDVDCPPLKDVQKAQLTRRLIMDALGQTYLQDMVRWSAARPRAKR
jgi:hypothetical protein